MTDFVTYQKVSWELKKEDPVNLKIEMQRDNSRYIVITLDLTQ